MPPTLPPLLTPALIHSIRTQPHLPNHAWYFVTGVTLSILNRPDEIPQVLKYALEKGSGNLSPSSSALNASGSGNGTALGYGNGSAGLSENGSGRDMLGKNGHGSVQSSSSSSLSSSTTSSTPTSPLSPSPPPSIEEQLVIARKMREALIKSAAIGGLPKTINALLALKPFTPSHLLDTPLSYSPSNRPSEIYDTASSRILHRGQKFFDNVYGKISKRVMGQMDRSGTEDLGLTARLMYGYILSNTAILSAAESSFVLIAGLVPQDVNPQLKGHLKGAVNNGASVEEVRAVRDVVIRICEAAGMTRLEEDERGGWGWREEVAKL